MAKQDLEKIKFELRDIDTLIPYANNSRTHSDEQIEQVVNSIKEFGFINPVIISNDGGILAGHCRVLAAKRIGMKRVPCLLESHLTPTQRRAYIIADNQLALNAGWDEEILAKELADLQGDKFNLDLLGFSADELSQFLNEGDGGESSGDDKYTQKVEAPIYEPQMEEPPSVFALCDKTKYKELCKEIESADIPMEVKEFLTFAAARHLKFDYKMIAEYYAHADKHTQELMEKSALVIIDFDKAIEYGFVKITKNLQEIMEAQNGQ